MSPEKFQPKIEQTARQAGNTARNAANSQWSRVLARMGFASKGIVYVIIGGLAALAAAGNGGGTTDRKGALQAIYEQPSGQLLLIVTAIGLIGYALWKFIEAIFDPEHKGQEPKGIILRISYAAIGVSYTLLAIAALQLSLGAGSTGKSSDAQAQDWTAKLLDVPFGRILLAIVGLIVIGIGGYQIYKGITAKFKKNLDLGQMSDTAQKVAIAFGRFGHIARGIVFGLIGVFLGFAALQGNPGEAKGLGGILQKLQEQTYGPFLLGIVAIGLVAYGLYAFFEARYRRLGQA